MSSKKTEETNDSFPENSDNTFDTGPSAETKDQSPDDMEAQALEAGWRPESEWKGDTSAWVDAETYLKRGKKFAAERDKNTELEAKITALQAENKKILAATARVAKIQEKAIKASTDAELKVLEARRQAAIEKGDTYQVSQIESEISDTKKTAEPDPTINAPNFETWLAKNDWYDKDKGASALADKTYKELAETGRFQYDDPDLFAAIDTEMRVRRPDLFTGSQSSGQGMTMDRHAPARVARGSSNGGARVDRKPAFSSLSKQDQEIYKQFKQEFAQEGLEFMKPDEWAQKLADGE